MRYINTCCTYRLTYSVESCRYGDYYFTTWGLILTLLGTLLAAMKTITTNMILVGRLKLHPLDLLIRMSPLAFIQCFFASWYTGELAKVREFSSTQMTYAAFFGLAINGCIAFFLNVVSFTVSDTQNPLLMTLRRLTSSTLPSSLRPIRRLRHYQ